MLATPAVAAVVAEAIEAHALRNYVLDPVMVASSGDVLLEPAAMDVLRTKLIPGAFLVTPNLLEAEILTDSKIDDEDAMAQAAERIVNDLGALAVLVKGGHLESTGRVVDVLYDGDVRAFRGERLQTTNVHGTGCTLSAAITAHLAKGESLHAAVRRSIEFVHNAIATAPGIGSGHGPLNHLADDD
jgi:hydroxymethylpyrimidine/phosphomethylpyrimidine kinase